MQLGVERSTRISHVITGSVMSQRTDASARFWQVPEVDNDHRCLPPLFCTQLYLPNDQARFPLTCGLIELRLYPANVASIVSGGSGLLQGDKEIVFRLLYRVNPLGRDFGEVEEARWNGVKSFEPKVPHEVEAEAELELDVNVETDTDESTSLVYEIP